MHRLAVYVCVCVCVFTQLTEPVLFDDGDIFVEQHFHDEIVRSRHFIATARERERKKERKRERQEGKEHTHTYTYVYLYVHGERGVV